MRTVARRSLRCSAKPSGERFARLKPSRYGVSTHAPVAALTKEQADAIVSTRTRQGDFHTLDDLKKVAGIDARALDERKDRIVFAGQ